MAVHTVSYETLNYNGKLQFKLLVGTSEIAVERFYLDEKVSISSEACFWLVSEDKIDFDDVVHKEALFTIKGKYDDRHYHGIINHFMLTGKGGRFYFYQASLVPYTWFLSLNKDYRIFQNMSTEEIVVKVLEDDRIPSDSYEFRLTGEYRKRRYCTQYGESDLHFISRLLEEDGIFYFFEHTKDNHLLILCDDIIACKRIAGKPEIQVHHNAGMQADNEVIENFGYVRSVRPGTVTQVNYNFKRPSLGLQIETPGETYEKYEIYEYPGNYGLPEVGERNTQIRLEEKKTMEESAQGTSNCARFIAGFVFDLTEHDFATLNKEYLLVSVVHEGSQSHVCGEYSGIGGDYSYANEFLAIPSTTALRPKKTYEKPYVRGLQSALVTGPEGQEIHTDEYGRIKVQFHWDREGKKDDKSSCWLRTSQPWSGNGWGFVSLPRIGDEVLVDFINGDPDWPIMVGTVNNAASPALYLLPDNKTQSGIKTRSTPDGGPDNFNELRFEDKKGAEEIYLRSEKDWNILVKNSKGQTISGNSSTSIGENSCTTIGGSSIVTVNKSSAETAEDITLTATSRITLVCGSSTIVLEPTGIKINGTIVDINS
jgi:type VI secretion system secreted protein VgrG